MPDTNGTITSKDSLSSLVKEAFIDPIRSVLIIDDQYPTWEQIFSDKGYDPNDTKWAVNSNILNVVQQFRKKSPALTVDIHDGSVNEEIDSYLHQSDLLVLDYQLEKTEPYGTRAAKIIAGLLSNKHFNLVVIHTAINDLLAPFNNILMSLLRPTTETDATAEGLTLIAEYEEAGHDDSESITEKIRDAVSEGTYIAFRKAFGNGKKPLGFITEAAEMEEFREICINAGWQHQKCEKVFFWAISNYEKRLKTDADKKPCQIKWNSPGETEHPWIRTSGGFIAFANKSDVELLKILGEALEDWKPSPSRMISSKIRAEISAHGVVAEDTVLNDRYAYWKFYRELLNEDSDNHRKSLIEAHAARHIERLFDMIGEEVIGFGLKLVSCDPATTVSKVDGFAAHYDVNASEDEGVKASNDKKALEHYNAYISTKPVSGWHLQPGHIFDAADGRWVCVSPACDLVPKQKSNAGINAAIDVSLKPFIAVKLHKRNNADRADINSNSMVFLSDKIEDEIVKYSVFPSTDRNASPVWRLFLAEKFGEFIVSEDKTADVRLNYLCGLSEALKIEPCDGKIIGQLRYEYALNLIKKLGVELTRIGLGFVAPT